MTTPARAAGPHLRRGRDARLVAAGSFVSHAFRPDLPGFPAAAEALVRALAVEWAPAVTVNAVVPGMIRKESGAHAALDPGQAAALRARVPAGRLGKPAAIAFLASPAAGYVTGQAPRVDGGLVTGGERGGAGFAIDTSA